VMWWYVFFGLVEEVASRAEIVAFSQQARLMRRVTEYRVEDSRRCQCCVRVV